MNKRYIIIGLLLPVISMAAYSQTVMVDGGEGGPKFSLSGAATGMFTASFLDDGNIVNKSAKEANATPPAIVPSPGVYYGDEEGKVGPGKNGYYTLMDFRMFVWPVPSVELYIKFLAQYRPGSPYLPLQLEGNGAKTFSDFSVDSAYGKVNAVEALGFKDFPLNVWLKAGKFDTLPSQFFRVSRHSSERATVMGSLRTTNDYAMQVELGYPVPLTKMVSLGVTTNVKLTDTVGVIIDEDAKQGSLYTWHGDRKYDSRDGNPTSEMPLHLTAKINELSLPFGTLSAEFVYAYNAMNIYSGNNFGLDLGLSLPINDDIMIPFGLAFALYGKNIDPIAGDGHSGLTKYASLYRENGYSKFDGAGDERSWDSSTTSIRQALRFGTEVGVKYTINDLLAEFNLNFIVSQIAHYYRDTLTLPSLSMDLRATYQNRFFIGGGVFLGTLADMEWKTRDDVAPALDDVTHMFRVSENVGFEIYGGVQFAKARLVLGYNINRGLSMNNYIETVPEAQIKYRQKDALFEEGLFERGGFFTKLSFSW